MFLMEPSAFSIIKSSTSFKRCKESAFRKVKLFITVNCASMNFQVAFPLQSFCGRLDIYLNSPARWKRETWAEPRRSFVPLLLPLVACALAMKGPVAMDVLLQVRLSSVLLELFHLEWCRGEDG